MMTEIPAGVEQVEPNVGSGLIDPSRERNHRVGEIHQRLFRELIELPSGVDATLGDKNYVLLVHEGRDGEQVASLQYNEEIKSAGDTTIFLHRALSMILGPDGILRGETHRYGAVIRTDTRIPVQHKELPKTVEPLAVDDIQLFRQFAAAKRTRLRNYSKCAKINLF